MANEEEINFAEAMLELSERPRIHNLQNLPHPEEPQNNIIADEELIVEIGAPVPQEPQNNIIADEELIVPIGVPAEPIGVPEEPQNNVIADEEFNLNVQTRDHQDPKDDHEQPHKDAKNDHEEPHKDPQDNDSHYLNQLLQETLKTGEFLIDINERLDVVILGLLPKNTDKVGFDDEMDIDDEEQMYSDDFQDPQQQQKLLEEMEKTGERLAEINASLDQISGLIAQKRTQDGENEA